MCYYWGETGSYRNLENRKPSVMDLKLVERITKSLKSAKPFYSLFGGEPLMHPQIENVIRLIKDAGSTIDTPTNGTLLKENAAMLVETGFDSIRVSIDGPQKVNDSQRGKGSYEKAMAGIEALNEEKQKAGVEKPYIGILYTVTPATYEYLEEFLINEVNLSAINTVTIQIENFITDKIGENYAHFLKDNFNITNDKNWRGLIRSTEDFREINTKEIETQVDKIKKKYKELGKSVICLPPTYTVENLNAYFSANWNEMIDKYSACPVPWLSCDITANGDVAPCHVFYDLIMGNLQKQSFEEIWNGENYKIFRDYMKEKKLMSICPGCCILYIVGQKIRKTT